MSSSWLFTAPWLLVEPWELLPDAAVLVQGDTIRELGKAASLARAVDRQTSIIPLDNCLLMPGLINAHCHLELSSLAALCPPEPAAFIPWVIELIAAKRKLAAADFCRAAATGQEKLLAAGTTTVGDFCSLDLAATFAREPARLRQVRYFEVIGRRPEGEQTILASLAAALDHPDSQENNLVLPGVAAHAPYTVSLALQRQLRQLARSRGRPHAIHLGESPAEKEFFLRGTGPIRDRLYPFVGWDGCEPESRGRDSIDLLLEHALLGRTAAVHLGTATRRQLQKLAAVDCRPILCPRSNYNLGNPLPDVPAMLDAGLAPALGTDSLASTPSLDLWEEMRFLAARFPAMAATDLLKMATVHGAAALGLGSRTGRLAAGWTADLIAVRLDFQGTPTATKLLATTSTAQVALVMVAGKIKKRPR